MNEEMKKLLDEARGLQAKKAKEGLSEDEVKRVGELATEIKEIGDRLDKEDGESKSLAALGDMVKFWAGQPARGTDPVFSEGRKAEPESRKDSIDAWFETQGYKEMAATGTGSSGHFLINDPNISPLARSNPKAYARELVKRGMDFDEVKTLLYSGQTGIGTLIEPEVVQAIIRGDMRENRVRDAFLSHPTQSTAISYVKENVVTNNAGAIVEATSITAGAPAPPASAYPESAISFTAATETVKSLGHMIPVTMEMLQDIPLMRAYIESRMMEMLDDKIDVDLIAGAGGNSLVGLANVSGTVPLDAAYFGSNPVESAGDPGEFIDRIRRAKTYLRVTSRANANNVLIHPYDLEKVDTIRDANGNYLYGGANSQNGTLQQRIGGLNVIETESITQGEAWVIAKNHFAVYDKLETTLEISNQNRNWWEHRILAIAVWTRLALVAYRAAGAAKVTLY